MKCILLILIIFKISSYTGDEFTVWKYLRKEGKLTTSGTAGLMANIKAVSKVRSIAYDDNNKEKVGLTDEEYVQKVNSGEYNEEQFVSDNIGFGLIMWKNPGRKKALYDMCKENIGDLKCQLKFLLGELKTNYSSLYKYLTDSMKGFLECAYRFPNDFSSHELNVGKSAYTNYALDYFYNLKKLIEYKK